MKKVLFPLLFLSLILCSCVMSTQNEYSGEMDAISSHSMTFGDDAHIMDIYVVTNTEVTDYETCAKEVIQHCIDNDFHTIHFSYDYNGYPSELNATIYESESDFESGEYLFKMSYIQDSNTFEYNIADHPEHFSLTIEPHG